MALNTDHDIMRSTARKYEMAEIGPVGEFTCYLDYIDTSKEQLTKLLAENESLRKEKERLEKIFDKFLS